MGTNSQSKNVINKIIVNNDTPICDPKLIANHMNTYFCNIGMDLSNKIVNSNGKKLQLPRMNNNSIFFKPTNNTEILYIIENMKMKNGGVDNIPTKALKILSSLIINSLTHIFNLCLEKSIWPDALKIAEVVPIYKSGNRMEMSNYRPITLISNLAKIFQKIVYVRLQSFFDKHKLIASNQYGFTKSKGTKDALSYITNLIYSKLDQSKPIALLS